MKGKISHWNDQKGYGFIRPQGGAEDLFFHISSLKDRNRRPVENEWISYRPSTGQNRKPCAVDVVYLAEFGGGRSRLKPGSPAVLLPALFLMAVLMLVLLTGLPVMVLVAYLLMSLVTYLVYALDKSAAKRNEWRIPENTLHLLALAGGWPGAMLAQERLRHKSIKQPFRTLFRITLVLNVCGLLLLLTPQGSSILTGIIELPG